MHISNLSTANIINVDVISCEIQYNMLSVPLIVHNSCLYLYEGNSNENLIIVIEIRITIVLSCNL